MLVPPRLPPPRYWPIGLALLLPFVPRPAASEPWQDAKQALSDRGVTPAIVYDGLISSTAAGGQRRGATYLGNLHLQLTLDGASIAGVSGLSAFLDGLWIHGGAPSAYAGDAQGISNIAGPHRFKFYEAWMQYNFGQSRLSALAGLYDLNSEFYRLESAGFFLNSSFGIGAEFGQSGVEGPSIFPFTAIGMRFAFKPAPNIVLRAAVLDGVPVDRPNGATGAFEAHDGALLVGEAAFLDRPASAAMPPNPRFRVGRFSGLPPYDNKLAIGAWHYTTRLGDLSDVAANGLPLQHHGSSGVYAIAEHLLFQGQTNSAERLSLFLEAGMGDAAVDRFGSYIGSGIVANGFVPGRAKDQAGLGIAVARNGTHYLAAQQKQNAPVTKNEIALEASYLAQLTDWFALQPDMQYVVHPNTNPALRNAVVLQLEAELSF
ncbi:MAG TPA: carbohydrate porin [Stellaceae bacterium]|jgi:porin|nr:carbohydrate porin [Stellaceae bacterium]